MTTTLAKLHVTHPVWWGVATSPSLHPFPQSTFYQAVCPSVCLSDQQQQQQHISLAADFLWALFKPFVAATVATVSTGQVAKLCSCVQSMCHVALSVSVSVSVCCAMWHVAWWLEFMAMRCASHCASPMPNAIKRQRAKSVLSRHPKRDGINNIRTLLSQSLSVCLSMCPCLILSLSLSLSTHSSTVQAMLSRATGYCTLSQ